MIQIVLHKTGVDPDFATKKFQIDVENLIGTSVYTKCNLHFQI